MEGGAALVKVMYALYVWMGCDRGGQRGASGARRQAKVTDSRAYQFFDQETTPQTVQVWRVCIHELVNPDPTKTVKP
jgi:hypothetical protein